MPTRDENLKNLTHKGDVEEIEKRIYYTLTDDKRLQEDRVKKTLALLIKHLYEKKLISIEDLDDILLEVVSN